MVKKNLLQFKSLSAVSNSTEEGVRDAFKKKKMFDPPNM